MTISNELIRVDLTGDGVATAFTFNFRVMAKADLQVYVAGVLKTLITDYDITGVDNPAGGTVTFVVAPANLATVVLIRHMDLHQPIDYTVGEKFPAETHERAIDRATLQKQQVDEEVKRSIRLGLFASPDTTDTVITDTPAARADRLLGFSADGLAVVPRGDAGQLEDLGGAVEDAEASAAAALVSEQNAAASSDAAAGFAADADASAVEAAASAAEAATELPQNSQSADYTIVLDDAGGHLLHPVSDNNPRTFTIPANASVAFPLGTTVSFVNRANVLTIAITTDTLVLAGTGAVGPVTLAANGLATAIKIAATVWLIGGTGINAPAQSPIRNDIVDAKGDLIAATAADTPARLAVGANRTLLEADSAQAAGVAWAARALGLKSVQVFTVNGTWTAPAGIRKILVQCIGGGGGGGGSSLANTNGGGGGEGSRTYTVLDSAAFGASQAVTIGAGGSAVAANTNAAGGTGGTTSFGALATALGGVGGTPGNGAGSGGAGGNGGTSTWIEPGAAGQAGANVAGNTAIHAAGGGSGGGLVNAAGVANSGGGGGAGGVGTGSGAGGSGRIIVFEYE